MLAGVLLLVTSGVASATIYEAENGQRIGQAKVYNDPVASNGAGVDSLGHYGWAEPTSGVTFNNMPATNSFTIGYSSNLQNSRVSLLVNGVHIKDFDAPFTGGWSGPGNYSTIDITGITVNDGDSITILRDASDPLENGINIDYIKYGTETIPEFPSIAFPVAAVIGLLFLIRLKKR